MHDEEILVYVKLISITAGDRIADAIIGRHLDNAIAKLPDNDYDRITKALERHQAHVRMEPDGDHVVLHVKDVRPWARP
jgi:hypothetical protein